MGVREIPGDPGDDLLMFPDESASYRESAAGETWDVLIVDDEPSVHDITKLVLSGYRFENREIRFFSAYDEASAVRMLETVPTLFLNRW